MDLHALLEKTERLGEVADAELVSRPQLRVLHLEVKPLLVALSIRINLAVQVVFLHDCFFTRPLHLYNFVVYREGFDSLEVATLDRGVELEILRVQQSMLTLHL